MTDSAVNLQGVSRTLLIPLACRAKESTRSDAMLRDPRAVELFHRLGNPEDVLKGMSSFDQIFTVMRMRQFDRYARGFLAAHPAGLVVDIGCGLDTRFDRLDNGQMTWLGIDLPEVIELRRRWLPDTDRSSTIAQSMLDLSWLDLVAERNLPVIFLAEGVFVYFGENQIRSLITALAERFDGCELVFDSLSTFVLKMHQGHSVLKRAGVEIVWGVDDPRALESWGLRLLDRWSYFDQPEKRLGAASLFRFIPVIANANGILHYRLKQRISGSLPVNRGGAADC